MKERAAEFHSPPDLDRLLTGVIERGYSFVVALADVIDNSIAAGADSVLVRLEHDGRSLCRVLIVDNGKGMTRSGLREAMRFGTRMTAQGSLGKFGLGLKVASLSQAPSFCVASRARGKKRTAGMAWSHDGIARGWMCRQLSPARAKAVLPSRIGPLDLSRGGTVVVWEQPERLIGGGEQLEVGLNRTKDVARAHLSLRFHRFLESGTRILVDSRREGGRDVRTARPLDPLDPFGYRGKGAARTPYRFAVPFDGRIIKVVGHIWPPRVLRGDASEGGWNLLGGPTRAQGLYVYRNGRLVQAGGWGSDLCSRVAHPPRSDAASDFSLARVEVHLTEREDKQFRLSVSKNSVDLPADFVAGLVQSTTSAGCSWEEYLWEARRVRKKARSKPRRGAGVAVPEGGLTQKHQRRLRKALAGKAKSTRPIRVEWGKTPGTDPVVLDRAGRRIVLNKKLRSSFLEGRRGSKGDIPVIKTLLFLLLRDEFDMSKDSRARELQRQELNRVLAALLDEPKGQ